MAWSKKERELRAYAEQLGLVSGQPYWVWTIDRNPKRGPMIGEYSEHEVGFFLIADKDCSNPLTLDAIVIRIERPIEWR